jgi:hypothetical protein
MDVIDKLHRTIILIDIHRPRSLFVADILEVIDILVDEDGEPLIAISVGLGILVSVNLICYHTYISDLSPCSLHGTLLDFLNEISYLEPYFNNGSTNTGMSVS